MSFKLFSKLTPQVSQSITRRAASDAILGLVDAALQSFDAESAGTTVEIAQTICTCFEHAQISKQFWTKFDVYSDEHDERSGLTGFIASQAQLKIEEIFIKNPSFDKK